MHAQETASQDSTLAAPGRAVTSPQRAPSATAPVAQASSARGDDPAGRDDPLARLLARAVRERGGAAAPPRPAGRTLARAEFKDGDATFDVDPYKLDDESSGTDTERFVGLEIKVSYTPARSSRTSKIGFVQTMKSVIGGVPFFLGTAVNRGTSAQSGDEGWKVDRLKGKKSPIYGQDDSGDASATTSFGWSSWYWTSAATLRDHVRLPRKAGETVTCDAVTYAFDETNSKYLGGVSWGFRTDAAGKSTLKAAAHHSGNPSGVQKEALKRWNEQADLADVTLRNAPTQAKVVVPGD